MKIYAAKLQDVRIMFNLIFLGLLSLFLVSCEKEGIDPDQETTILELRAEKAEKNKAAPAPGEYTITELALNDPEERFEELVKALSFVDQELDAGLVDLFLSNDVQYTVFAPNNEAFGRLYDLLKVDGITELDPELVLNVLLYHVTDGRRAANSVVPANNDKTIQTLMGVKFMVNSDGQIKAVGNVAGILDPNISASNGIIHEISEVLLPITL